MIPIPAAVLAYFALAAAAEAAFLDLSHPDGELIDRGASTAHFFASYPDRIDCAVPATIVRTGRVVTISARRLPLGAAPGQCHAAPQVSIGVLSAGWWTIVLQVVDANSLVVDTAQIERRIDSPDSTCNRDPAGGSKLVVAHRTLNNVELAARIAADTAFAASLGSPSSAIPVGNREFGIVELSYAPLDNPIARRGQAYRFFGKPGIGPTSHVFTIDRNECRQVEQSGAWLFEGTIFRATPSDSQGRCSVYDEMPLWKAFGDSNHRFTTDRAVVAEMTAKGWVDEGVAMCVKK
jgi:hypothetical protein